MSVVWNTETLPVIGFTGPKGIGKSWAAAYIGKKLSEMQVTQAAIVALADPLKSFAAATFGPKIVGALKGESKEREAPLPFAFGDITSVRKFLQVVGTEMFRKCDPEIWVKSLMERVRAAAFYVGQQAPGAPLVVLVPDVRFDNEAAAIAARPNGCLVVMRWHEEHPAYAEKIAEMRKDGHASEAGISDQVLASAKVDYYDRKVDNVRELALWCDDFIERLIVRWGADMSPEYTMDKLARKELEKEQAAKQPQLRLVDEEVVQ